MCGLSFAAAPPNPAPQPAKQAAKAVKEPAKTKTPDKPPAAPFTKAVKKPSGKIYEIKSVLSAPYSGVITPAASEFISGAIDKANSEKFDLLVIQLDTPGGLDGSMREIIKRILASKTPVAVYVYPQGARAASAGVFIAMASRIVAMAPGTNIGAAHPVMLGAMPSLVGDKEGKKKDHRADGAAGQEKILGVVQAAPVGDAANEGNDGQINEDDEDGNH